MLIYYKFHIIIRQTDLNTLKRNERSLEIINNEITIKVATLETGKSSTLREIVHLKNRLSASECDSVKLTKEVSIHKYL